MGNFTLLMVMKKILIAVLMVAAMLPSFGQRKKIANLDSLVNVMSIEISDLKAHIATSDSSYNQRITELQEDNNGLHETVSKQQKTIEKLTAKLHAMDAQLTVLVQGAADEFVQDPRTEEDSIVWLVQSFYGAKKWSDQMQYVLNGERVEPLMRQYYSSGYSQEKVKRSMITVQEEHVELGQVIVVDADVYSVYVKRTEEGLKIDWQATTGTDEYSFEAFKAEKSTVARQFRVTARLGNEYANDYGLTNAKFYNIKIGESAFVAKNSDAGKRLYEIVKDGYAHDVIVQVRYEKKSTKGGYARMFPVIVGFVKEGWSLE